MLVFLARLGLRLSSLAVALAALVFLTFSPATPAKADPCTSYVSGLTFPGGVTISQCTTDIIIGAGGSITIDHNNTPYTASGNALIGVVNNSGSAIYDLYITGFNNSSPGILNFNSLTNTAELLCSTSLAPRLACGNALATTRDEGINTSTGQIVYFTGIGTFNNVAGNTGDVIFSGDLANGQSAIFGTLADICPTSTSCSISPVPVPEPGSFAVLGTGLIGLALYRFRRRRAALRRRLQLPTQPSPLQLKPQQS